MEIHLPLGRSCHLEAFGKNRSEGVPDDRHFRVACDNDVHAVDEPRAGECPLRGEEVHHDEVAAVNTPDALGLDQPSHRELESGRHRATPG